MGLTAFNRMRRIKEEAEKADKVVDVAENTPTNDVANEQPLEVAEKEAPTSDAVEEKSSTNRRSTRRRS